MRPKEAENLFGAGKGSSLQRGVPTSRLLSTRRHKLTPPGSFSPGTSSCLPALFPWHEVHPSVKGTSKCPVDSAVPPTVEPPATLESTATLDPPATLLDSDDLSTPHTLGSSYEQRVRGPWKGKSSRQLAKDISGPIQIPIPPTFGWAEGRHAISFSHALGVTIRGIVPPRPHDWKRFDEVVKFAMIYQVNVLSNMQRLEVRATCILFRVNRCGFEPSSTCAPHMKARRLRSPD